MFIFKRNLVRSLNCYLNRAAREESKYWWALPLSTGLGDRAEFMKFAKDATNEMMRISTERINMKIAYEAMIYLTIFVPDTKVARGEIYGEQEGE